MVSRRRKPNVGSRRICEECVGEVFLRGLVRSIGRDSTYDYCEGAGKTFSIDQMADEVERAQDDHYRLTPLEPEYGWMEHDWEREGYGVADVISDCAELDDEPAEDIRSVLEKRHYDFELATMGEENPFESGAHYAERWADGEEYKAGWLHFEESLRTQGRYFNSVAESTLKPTFTGLGETRDHDGQPVLVKAGPGTG
ncbi:MAG: hypothetical protein ACREAC_30290, partial [Blastocatellia bacterium]